MKTNQQFFSDFLGAQCGNEVRRVFEPEALRASLHTSIPATLKTVDFASKDIDKKLANVIEKRLAPIRKLFRNLAVSIETADEIRFALRSKVALELTPFVIGSQYLIHSVCGNWNNESLYAMSTLQIHAADVGVGLPGSSRVNRYQELLREFQLTDVVDELLHSGTEPRISAGAFNFPSTLIVLGHFPESLTGEILGVNLFLRQCGLLPPFEFLSDNKSPSIRSFLDFGNDPFNHLSDLGELSQLAVSEFISQSDESGILGIQQGFYWAQQQVEKLCMNVFGVLERWLDPREAARQLMCNRRIDACQYHENTKLNKISMQSLLKQDDPLSFLEQLAASGYVKEGKPESSPLLNNLISPKGKMFRIFSQDDIAVLKRWISGLPYTSVPIQPAAHLIWEDDGSLGTIAQESNVKLKDEDFKSIRHMYQRLLRSEVNCFDEQYSMDYVKKWLRTASNDVENNLCPLPNEWQPGSLKQWLQIKHEASNKSLDLASVLPSRETVIADILSMAPLTLIDGAWLLGFAHPQVASSAHGFRLFETFYDELGNGVEKQNHPVIYRKLLGSVHGELPATSELSFAKSACFNDQDFELPIFWLSIGRYPQTYTPEILGLNLAMELSGVGGGYRKTHKALVKYGFPTMFVDLHNTIDNISTGHTAWAAASIDSYISAFSRNEQPEIWNRIRTGFVSLNRTRKKKLMEKFKEKMRAFL